MPGVQPDKWLQRWRDRRPGVPLTATTDDAPLTRLARRPGAEGIADGTAVSFDVVFVREPDDAPRSAPPGLLRIPLYTETMAVLAAKGHELAAFDELAVADLDGERWLDPVDAVTAGLDEVRSAVELVAANVGLLVLPLPYARVLGRRDIVARPVTGVPATRMGIAWAAEREGDEAIDEFVGIVRGRTANSSRSSPSSTSAATTPVAPAPARRSAPRGGRSTPKPPRRRGGPRR